MRGYRPSRFRKPVEQSVDDRDRAKRENMRQYMERVAEGLPLFGDDVPLPDVSTAKPKSKAKARKA